MRALRFTTLALAFAMFAGCGQSGTSIPQSRSPQAHQLGKSWMLPEAKNEDLLYVSDDAGNILILSYPTLSK